eukprot:92-Pelagococcus_subviridis.AAC.1
MQNFCPARAYAAPQSEQNPALLDAAPALAGTLLRGATLPPPPPPPWPTVLGAIIDRARARADEPPTSRPDGVLNRLLAARFDRGPGRKYVSSSSSSSFARRILDASLSPPPPALR